LNGSAYTFASVASAATAILITPILTRSLGLQEYDGVAVAIVVLNIAINLLSLGLPTAIIRAVHSEREGSAIARSIVIMGFAVVLVTSGFAGLVATFAGQGAGIALAIVAGGAGGSVAMVLAFYVATENPRSYVVTTFGLSLGGPAVGLICTLVFGAHALTYVAGLALAYFSVALVSILRLLKPAPLEFSRRRFARALFIGLPMVPHQLAIGAASGTAVLLAALLLPRGAAAGAQLALLIASAPLAIVSALTSGWTPIILAASEKSRGERLEETSRVIAILAALGGGALSLLAPWFIQFLAPADKFDISAIVPTVAIACAAPALAVAYTSYLQIVIASGKTLTLAILSPLALGLGFAIGYVIIPVTGLPGAGLMFVVVYALFVAFARMLSRRVSAVRWSESKVMFAVIFAATTSLLGAVLPWEAPPWAVVRLGLAAALLCAALVAFVRNILAKPAE
jgi:O-antigen/teichoic acid export membrane protein